jgi:T5SS/PEP-CTERM-associated repeat protein
MRRVTLLVLAAFVAVCLAGFVPPAHAAITYSTASGSLSPSNPNSWTSDTEARVGYTVDGFVTVDSGSGLLSGRSSLGYTKAGTVTVTGAGSTWTNGTDLHVGQYGLGILRIIGGGLVTVAGRLGVDVNGSRDSAILMGTGGMLALYGNADDSLAQFFSLIDGTDKIEFWDDSVEEWSDLSNATPGADYTLEYMSSGALSGYTVLSVFTYAPEPGAIALLLTAGLAITAWRLRRRA